MVEADIPNHHPIHELIDVNDANANTLAATSQFWGEDDLEPPHRIISHRNRELEWLAQSATGFSPGYTNSSPDQGLSDSPLYASATTVNNERPEGKTRRKRGWPAKPKPRRPEKPGRQHAQCLEFMYGQGDLARNDQATGGNADGNGNPETWFLPAGAGGGCIGDERTIEVKLMPQRPAVAGVSGGVSSPPGDVGVINDETTILGQKTNLERAMVPWIYRLIGSFAALLIIRKINILGRTTTLVGRGVGRVFRR